MIHTRDINAVKKLRDAAAKRGVLTRSDRRSIEHLLARGAPESAFSNFVDPSWLCHIKAKTKGKSI